MGIIYGVAFSLVLLVNYILSKTHRYNDGLNKTIYNCLVSYESKATELFTSCRGKNYYSISGPVKNAHPEDKALFDYNQKYCITSLWAFTHIYLYVLIGFFCPSLFWLTFIGGAAFEVFEYFKWGCHDIVDVLYNSLGFFIGYYLNGLYLTRNNYNASIFVWLAITVALFGIVFYNVHENQKKKDEINVPKNVFPML
jgi:hypothetical protein